MGSLVQKLKDMWVPPEDDFEEDEEEYEEQSKEDVSNRSINTHENIDPFLERKSSLRSNSSNNKVVNIHTTAQLQVVLFKPESFGEETRTIADELLKTHTVVLNLENTQKEVSRRIIDFLSGVAYANSGKIKRIATGTFIITPYNVDFTGDDLLDELESSGVYF